MFELLFKFIFELTIPYRGAPFTRVSRISSLDNEAFYVSVEHAIVVVSTGTERKKILKREPRMRYKVETAFFP